MKVAIVGRRNTGKSTFVNTLAQAERMIVSEVPGTTRDSVDVRFELDGKTFIAIDTAGVRRTKSIARRHRLLQLAPRPAEHPPGRRGAAVLRLHAAAQQGRQAAVRVHRRAVQAVHLRRQQVGPAARPDADREVGPTTCATRSARCGYVPIAFITGQTGKNVKALLNHAQMLFKQARQRVRHGRAEPAGARGRGAAPAAAAPESRGPKIYYATQVGVAAADDRAVLQRAARRSTRPISGIC